MSPVLMSLHGGCLLHTARRGRPCCSDMPPAPNCAAAETPTAFKRLHSRMSGLSPSAAQLRDNTSDAVSLASASTSPVHPDGGGAASLVASSRSTPGSPGRALDEGGRNAQPWKLGELQNAWGAAHLRPGSDLSLVTWT